MTSIMELLTHSHFWCRQEVKRQNNGVIALCCCWNSWLAATCCVQQSVTQPHTQTHTVNKLKHKCYFKPCRCWCSLPLSTHCLIMTWNLLCKSPLPVLSLPAAVNQNTDTPHQPAERSRSIYQQYIESWHYFWLQKEIKMNFIWTLKSCVCVCSVCFCHCLVSFSLDSTQQGGQVFIFLSLFRVLTVNTPTLLHPTCTLTSIQQAKETHTAWGK